MIGETFHLYQHDMVKRDSKPTKLKDKCLLQYDGLPYNGILLYRISNIYTIACPPVRGDNPRAFVSGLSPVQVDNHGITTLYHGVDPCTLREISCLKGGEKKSIYTLESCIWRVIKRTVYYFHRQL